MFSHSRFPSALVRLSFVAALLAGSGVATAQTAPQLLPYTAKLVAGGGSTAATANSTCARGTAQSGFTSSDIYGDGCLATEITLSAGSSGPRYAITDATGAVYFSDYNNGLVRRIDPVTGVVTTIAGGAASNPAGTTGTATSCGTLDAAHTTVSGDKFADGCVGTAVKLGKPTALVFSPTTGDLYIADTYNYDVRRMSLTNGGVAGVSITSAGSGYTTAPTVTFSSPSGGGTTATGTAKISSGGIVTGVTITYAGSGYSASAMPTVTFSASGSGVAATGTTVYTGVMSMAAGSNNGTSTTAKGYINATANAATTCNVSNSSTPCALDAPYGLAFDAAGNLYIAEEYYDAILVLNTNATGSTTVTGITIPAQTIVRVVGYRTTGTCLSGSNSTTITTGTGPSGCNYGNYVTATAATATYLDAPYGVAVDTGGDIFIANEYNNDVAEVVAGTGILNNYSGLYPPSGNSSIEPVTKRGAAGFATGTDYGIAVDPTNNVYTTDALAGYVWREDATTNTMFVVAGGGTTATTAGTACSATGTGSLMTATDTFGDGCVASLAMFSHTGTQYASTGIFGVSNDSYGDIFVGDEGNGLIREVASGTQFGNTGASATDYVDIHFAAGDTPIAASGATVPFAITANATVFAVGTPVCTTNADNNGANTTDCVVPVTASPSAPGAYAGTLTVKSTNVPSGTSFALSGNFAPSPITRLSLSFASTTTTCGASTTFATTDTVAITAALTANGPSAPTGTITFYSATNGGTPMQIGTPQNVVNLGTASSPMYGAVLNSSFGTPGSYTISATYSGDTGTTKYFTGSSATDASALVSTTPTFSIALTPGYTPQSTVTAGQTALYSITLSQTVYTGAITFSCTGLPANASCVFSPTVIQAPTGCSVSNVSALSILTSGGVPAQVAIGLPGSGPLQLLTMTIGLGLALLIGLRRRKLPMQGLWMVLALLLASSGLMACGGVVNPVNGHVYLPYTPLGTSTVTVIATGSAGGVVSTLSIPLIVK